ncbi:MAG TPA: TrkA C-terminal domain-containing protein [Sphaerochaeta sp.]|nr:TrkA C-terminal domain-containing protein [Sphaerochaeta sp.]
MDTIVQNPPRKRHESMAVYEKIALDIANRIVRREIAEGVRLSGRSVMSSEYGVSPETIRRAFSLLEEMEVVAVKTNSGVSVISRENAKKYIAKYGKNHENRKLLSQMRHVLGEREQIDKEFFILAKDLIEANDRFSASNPFPTYEYTIKEDSLAVGNNLGALNFWQQTGGTVIAIRRDGSILLSPGPDLTLEVLDTLIFVGNQDTLSKTKELLDLSL